MSSNPSAALIDRVCFNFQDTCNMNCPYCYIPFTHESVELARCRDVVERCADLGVRVITFGGGDPFLLEGFTDLIRQTAKLGIEVHIDTNGSRLSPTHYPLLEERASLLALPLDGPNRMVHANMRHSGKHFEIVLGHLEALSKRTIRLKVNTVVSSLNHQTISQIGELLRSYRIAIWSLYQFWPLHNAESEMKHYGFPDELFDAVIGKILRNEYAFKVEPGPIRERHGTYLFVSHTGSLYTHEPRNISRYKVLGSIFDDATILSWNQHNVESVREPARSRYVTLERR